MLYEHRDRWLQVSERPAGNGGLVVVWTDVTALKQGEILLREAFDRINQELAAARQLQLSMVPRHFPAWSEAQPIEIQAVMEPAREVGGDLYDFFLAAPGKFCFVVGDVSGKGTAAALFMARTRSLVRATVALWHQTAGEVPAPSAIVQAVNRELCLDNSERMFVTVFLATLDLDHRRGRLCQRRPSRALSDVAWLPADRDPRAAGPAARHPVGSEIS